MRKERYLRRLNAISERLERGEDVDIVKRLKLFEKYSLEPGDKDDIIAAGGPDALLVTKLDDLAALAKLSR